MGRKNSIGGCLKTVNLINYNIKHMQKSFLNKSDDESGTRGQAQKPLKEAIFSEI